MDLSLIKKLSPAYYTSIAAIFLGALAYSSSTVWLSVLGMILLLLALGLNFYAVYLMIARQAGLSTPAVIERLDNLGAKAEQQIHDVENQLQENYDNHRIARAEAKSQAAEQAVEKAKAQAAEHAAERAAEASQADIDEAETQSQPVVAPRRSVLPKRSAR
ncbi:MAG: hypothetical protein Q4P78_00250 [Rothia sp. (in: high G+C Gram-positive bacteria)]|uniref:hypothetical protein n=1 Tax=Rothia sp. (in: high G+C Gram-positive bacteria) TaxID=1885016 RepID=UPI0026DEC376|nr:hypothetical protein [Rothia sp. (in: high G+C Gram-positive bacteria)]MDO5749619.1 hypothetical protein [Rothia sp. (in: high G+C Gram-positive bacteria)]